ncbi:MAG TPA: hypothetical protein VF363_11640 [Candidatus Eisenbacteria bacterium]
MRTVARSAALIAFSVACGYAKLVLFPFLFFVEIFSVAVFLSGAILGAGWGAWIGAVSRLVFSVANPYGPPHPWVLAAQVAGAAVVGALGGAVGRRLLPWGAPGAGEAARIATLAIAGVAGTAAYDLLTNVAQGWVFGSVPAALALAAIPSAQHVASNGVIFAVIGRLALPWLGRDPRIAGDAA